MEQKQGYFRPIILWGLLIAALLSAAAGLWLIVSAQPRPAVYWVGGALLCIAVVLMLCLSALRRTFHGLDTLKDTVQGWSSTKPETLRQELSSLSGEAGKLGGEFYEQMCRMEVNLSRLEKSAREKAEQTVRKQVVREGRDHLLPRVLEEYPSRENFLLTGIVEDGGQPGSTYYDYFFVDPGLVCITVAQLPQNGVPDVLQMVMAQTMLRGRLRMGRSLTETMSDINASLFDYGSTESPVSMLTATLNTWSGQMKLINAGLPSPLLMRAGEGYEWLELPVSVPLGQMENVSYRAAELLLHAGDHLFLFTDGLGAMENREGVPFRNQELRTILNLSRTREEDSRRRLRYLASEAAAYCRSESEVLGFSALLLEYHKTASHGHEHTVPASVSYTPELMDFMKERLQEHGRRPREYARLAILVEELFALCCRRSEKGSKITLDCAVAPDAESVTLRLHAALGGINPMDTVNPGPDGQTADYISRQADYVKFQAGTPEDTLTIVWFFAAGN